MPKTSTADGLPAARLAAYLPAMPKCDGFKPLPMYSQTATVGLNDVTDVRIDTAS